MIYGQLSITNNNLEVLPMIPYYIGNLNYSHNKLTSLSTHHHCLPDRLVILYCNYNKLISLPELPDTILTIECDSNFISGLHFFLGMEII